MEKDCGSRVMRGKRHGDGLIHHLHYESEGSVGPNCRHHVVYYIVFHANYETVLLRLKEDNIMKKSECIICIYLT